MAEKESRYPPYDGYEEGWRERKQDDEYRRDRDRHHGRYRRKKSRERRSSETRHSRRGSRSRSRSRSHSHSRHRDRNRDDRSSPYRSSSGSRRRSLDYEYDQDDTSRRHPEMDDQGNRDSQGFVRDERPRSSGGKRHEKDWRMKLTSIRDAHFNRSKQPPLAAQNQFQNDGSFLEMFKKKMAAENSEDSSLTPNSLVLASSSIPYNSDISLPPLTAPADPKPQPSTSTADQDLDGVPIKKTTLPAPVSVGRRRCAKPLKTGVVFKKQQKNDEDEGSQEKLDAWSRYLQEVQKYKKDNLVEEDSSRPLVK